MTLASIRGHQADAEALISRTVAEAPQRGEGISTAVAEWTKALLHNGLGNYAEALAAARRGLEQQEYPSLRYPGWPTGPRQSSSRPPCEAECAKRQPKRWSGSPR